MQTAAVVTVRRSFASSSTPRFAAATTAEAALHHHHARSSGKFKLPEYGQMWPVIGVMGGLVGLAGLMGIHTARQQLCNSTSVQVTKMSRQSIVEVDNPDAAVSSADKFINKSFLRKIAHIQDNKNAHNYPQRPDPFTR